MGKVKSVIITALLVAAIIVLTLFATISFGVSGSNDAFMINIPFGSELAGDASVIFYPEGVIAEAKYKSDTFENEEKLKEYEDKYSYVESAHVYVDKDKLTDADGNQSDSFIKSIKSDAQLLSDRFGEKGYSSYSVTVVDDYLIKVSVPSGLTYVQSQLEDVNLRNAAYSEVSHALNYISVDGGLSIRSDATYSKNNNLYQELDKNDPYTFNRFFKGASVFQRGGTTALKIDLTDEGFEEINKILTASSDGTAYLYAGKTSLQLTFTMGTALTEKSMYFQSSRAASEDYAILINSIAHGKMLANELSDVDNENIIITSPVAGKNVAVAVGVVVLVIILLAAFLPVIRYKKLGLVNALMVLTYSIALLTAIYIIGIELTLGGLFAAILGLALLSFSNFFTFEAVRRETALGRTIEASVKLGYKKSMFAILDIHVMLIIAAVVMTLVGVGELSACGLIFLIGSIASFVLYWFTRFMWYVISSLAHNKFAFCGYAKEVEDDE